MHGIWLSKRFVLHPSKHNVIEKGKQINLKPPQSAAGTNSRAE